MTEFRHADGVEAGAAAQVDQSAASRECGIQQPPHFAAHVLDEVIVAPRTVVVGSDTVKGIPRVTQLRLRGRWCRLGDTGSVHEIEEKTPGSTTMTAPIGY